jgi:Uncharacterized conserved protein
LKVRTLPVKEKTFTSLSKILIPRLYSVFPVGSPNDIKKSIITYGFSVKQSLKSDITIFDQSWYGHALIERVEGFCSESEWKRAYREINEFEEILEQAGAIVLKLWLHIDKETQLERFKSGSMTPKKVENYRRKLAESGPMEDYKIADNGNASENQHNKCPTDCCRIKRQTTL